jgi:diguanylate cyclase (GGDEF)-like protein/PAS domain S-box-containing protein
MGKSLRVVVVGDSQSDALRVVADVEQCGYEPSFSLVSSEAALAGALHEGCDIVVAWRATPSLPLEQVLQAARAAGPGLPVIVYADSFTEEEIVDFVRAGAADCLRRGDLARLKPSLERELRSANVRRAGASTSAEASDRYRALIEEIPALTYVAWADETGSRAYVSPQVLSMTRFTPGEWLSEPDMWVRRLHPRDRERVLRQFRQACATGGRFASEYRILDRDGREVWWRDEGRALPGPDGTTRFVRGFVLDVTEQKLAEQSVRRMRYYDQLTGLPNRDLFLKRLGRSLAEAARTGRPLALVLLALHRFKEITNTLGHHNGDLIVRELAARLGEVLGASDRVARLKGDEFGMLLPDADSGLAGQVAEATLAALEKPFMVQKLPIEVTASVGLAIAPEHGKEAEVVLRRADAALQAALKLGGGASVLYSGDYEPHDPTRLALLGELRQALEANQLVLHYQPKVDLKTRTVIGTEALLRWPHPRRGLVPPGEFIRLAEQGTGLMRPLTRWVLDRAVSEARGFTRNGRALPVAVNVSARNLYDEQLVGQVTDALQAHGVPADRLQLEVTESAVMADTYRAGQVLSGLARGGVRIAIDDFGTGYSSLGLLRHLPVTELKIDGSFVRGMVGNGSDGSADTTIVRSTNDLAHNLGLSVVAEGVEDQWTLDVLSTFGCDHAQGFFIARPMPADDLMGWLDKAPWTLEES